MSEYFPEPKPSGERVKVELDLSNQIYLGNLKSDLDTLDTDKLKNVPTN